MVKSAKANLRASHVALVQGQRTVGIWVGIANGRMVMRDLIVLKAWRSRGMGTGCLLGGGPKW